ncbi:hypothetical protein EDD15DRAFT_2377846 [Pisolithus albus]|nr:hypothetical protein EDD15DRAFT_2377846 [Pisolithus albus]
MSSAINSISPAQAHSDSDPVTSSVSVPIAPTSSERPPCTPSDGTTSLSPAMTSPSDAMSSPSDDMTSPSNLTSTASDSTTTSESSTSPPSDPISYRLSLARERLLHGGFYLGDSSIIDSLHWVEFGRCHALTSISIPDCNADDETSQTIPPVELRAEPSCPDHATLSAIVRIDRNDFWLTSDGGYQGPTALCKEILHVKPSCTLTDPACMPVSADFPAALETLRMLTEKCVTPGYSAGTSFFSTDAEGASRFKLRHKLFECIDADEDGVEGSVVDDTGDFPFLVNLYYHIHPVTTDTVKMEDWPLTREKNRAELLTLCSTHRILPLPAYDLAGNLIRPAAYRRCLQGAIVKVHFTMSHWAIAKAKRDVYGGEIQLIRVLVPPTTPTPASKKRKLPQRLDSEVMPPAKSAKT